MTADRDLREGGVDGGGSFVEYVHDRRREQGWVHRVFGDRVQIETFSGDYLVMHHVARRAIRYVFSEAEIAEAMGHA